MKKSRLEGEKITTNDTLRNMVIIESGEYNLTNVYAMRHQLLRNHVLEDEPLIVTKDFDFFEKDFKALIARNNQIIVEVSFKIIKKKASPSVCSKNSQAKTPSLLYSQLNQNRPNLIFIFLSALPPVPVISSPVITNIAELLPQIHVPQEVLQSSENENIPTAVAVDSSSARQIEKINILQEQNTSDGVNMSVPQFLDLFKRNKNKSTVMIPTDDAEKSSSNIAIPQKMEYIRNIDKTVVGQNFNKHLERYNLDVATNNANYDLTSKTIPENLLKSKYLSEKSPVYTQLFTAVPQPQNLKNSGINVMKDQGNLSVIRMIYHDGKKLCKSAHVLESIKRHLTASFLLSKYSTTIAIASAMLQNSPSQWFQSSGIMTAIKSKSAQISKASSPEKIWQTKKNLPLKSSFTNENYIRDYHRGISTERGSDMPQEISARESKKASSDLRLSSLSNNHNTNSLYSISRNNPARNFSQYRLLHQSKDNTDDAYDYRKDRQSARIRDNTVWENSRHSSSLFHTHSNTREIFSKTYQGRVNQNSSRSGDMIRGGRTIKQSTNRSGGYYSTFSRFQSIWSLSAGHNEGRRYSNRAMTHFHLKRQFINGAQLKEGKDDQRDECLSRYQEEQHGRISDQFRKDITKGVDVLVLIDEVQKSQNEQSSRSVQQLNSPFRPALMMKELEKYIENDKTITKSYANTAKKNTTEDEKVQNKTL
ncbi:unnamed protein product, partial [Onchocerca flexuosa]|uniref:KH_10 domain-containing protein n=1 Tax=Onchocerca flexuosa TaxID=387005 RepID=A0A183I2S2_9BILA